MTKSLQDLLSGISTSLAVLALQVRQEALAGLGSRNKVAELVLLPVLRHVYAAPGLVNANALAANFPGVDLYDPVTKLGVQVTSETTAAKVAETIDTLIKGSLPLSRLVVAFAADSAPNFQDKTRTKWAAKANGHFAFDPRGDVLDFDRLLGRIEMLPGPAVAAIDAELNALIRGAHAIHVMPHLRQQAEAQIAEEQRIARYIPDVFVETQDTKYQARCFTHPALFARRIADWFTRDPLAGLNRLAVTSGVPPIRLPDTEALTTAQTPEGAVAAAEVLTVALEETKSELATYAEIGRPEGAKVPRDGTRAHVLAQTRYNIEMSASGTKYRLDERLTELSCVTARIFLLVGPAGQGKTNFLCDLTERFLLRHEIPCAYVTARQLGRVPNAVLADVLASLIFPTSISNLHEGLNAIATTCAERRQPFVIVIDGLNEHPDVRVFAGELEHLLETLVHSPHVRVIMTCRSEFLDQRFGTLLSGPLSSRLHTSRAHGQRFDDNQFRELTDRYFRFFRVQPKRVAHRVLWFLQRDVLLLRFFCEAYGARGRDASYDQPVVAGLYRDEIFRRYTDEKLGRAEHIVAADRSDPKPLVRKPELRRVLVLVTAYMIDTGKFADVPRGVVPPELDIELTALLDEGLVLRRDLGSATSLLSEPEEVLNFTFDEFRDFIIAQYLLDLYVRDPEAFSQALTSLQPTSAQSLEGVQRFLFYASRFPTNTGFLAEYRANPWYEAVYDTEVFAVVPTHLDESDRLTAIEALRSGGHRARHYARNLSLCWESDSFPLLNLDLLISVALDAEPEFFDGVLVPTFGTAYYGQESLGASFCVFVENQVFPEFTPADRIKYSPLFRLLLLLLPVDATPTLESPAMISFRQLIDKDTSYACELLQEAVADGQRWHRAFVWRLLSGIPLLPADSAFLVAAARTDIANATEGYHVRNEAERFLLRQSNNTSTQ